MEKEREYQTKNGVRIYSYKNPSLHGFNISLFVRAGVAYEEEKYAGITHFFEHAAIRNVNKRRGMKLYSELDKRGLEFNASTFSEMVQFYVSGASENFVFGAEMISELLLPIELDRDEMDAERKRIKAEIRESDEKASLSSFTAKVVFHDTPLAYSIVGTNKSADAINLARLEAYRERITSAENIFFYVTGNFTDSDIKTLASYVENINLRCGLERENIVAVPSDFGKRPRDIYVKNADFSMLRFTFDLDMSRYSMAEIDLLYDILLSGYSSKLFIELSEKRGLCYDISGAAERYKNIGTLHFAFELKGKDIAESVRIVLEILDEIKSKTFDSRDCMKAAYVDNAYMLYDDFRELNFTFAYDNHIMGEKYLSVENRKRRYKSVTPERIRSIASEIFKRENLTLTMKGDKNKIDKEEILKILDGLK